MSDSRKNDLKDTLNRMVKINDYDSLKETKNGFLVRYKDKSIFINLKRERKDNMAIRKTSKKNYSSLDVKRTEVRMYNSIKNELKKIFKK